jgi:hypothetical protein
MTECVRDPPDKPGMTRNKPGDDIQTKKSCGLTGSQLVGMLPSYGIAAYLLMSRPGIYLYQYSFCLFRYKS